MQTRTLTPLFRGDISRSLLEGLHSNITIESSFTHRQQQFESSVLPYFLNRSYDGIHPRPPPITLTGFRMTHNAGNLRWCSTCLNMSTRPRISFDEDGRCNACVWAAAKTEFDWTPRQQELERILNEHRSNGAGFDCVVPVSGGKDGSYVAYQLKHRYGMKPLCITVRPPLPLPLGDGNLERFIDSGFDHIRVSPDPETMKLLNKHGFIEMGFPYYGWLVAIQAAVLRVASRFGISLIFYGEDGEVEYGGTDATQQKPFYDIDYMRDIYLEGGHEKVLNASGVAPSERFFFEFPSHDEMPQGGLRVTHWSYFENWDPYRNYIVARDHCGLQETSTGNSGTFTNFAQNDQKLYALHTYLMYLKFGFGRATQDAGIEIRRGSMSREQALNLVRVFDGQYPDEFLPDYLDYYEMSLEAFEGVLDKWANRELFERINGRWSPTFTVM